MAVAALAGVCALGGCGAQRKLAQPVAPPAVTLAPAGHVPRAGESLSVLDLDGDGHPDVWRFSRPGPDGRPVLVRKELDLDGDGRTDLWEEYVAGALSRRAYDLDGDGRPDLVLVFEGGALLRKEDALDAEGRPHAWAFYRDGRLIRRERDTDGDGRADTLEPAQPPAPETQK